MKNTIEERFKDKFVNNKKGTETGGILIEDTEELLDFIQQELKKAYKKGLETPHGATDGWCCACEYDQIILNKKLKANDDNWKKKIEGLKGTQTIYDKPYWVGWNEAIKQFNKEINDLLKEKTNEKHSRRKV
jgi:hypothetical protein